MNNESGLKGISEDTNDMRQILEKKSKGDGKAQLAFDMFVHRLKCFIGAMAASLEGCDVLVFTGGIGENAAEIRNATCKSLHFLGLVLDEKFNHHVKDDQLISSPESKIPVLVIHTKENWMIAKKLVTPSMK